MSAVLDFYLEDEGKTSDGYTLEQVWQWSDNDYELEKNYVQWLFPTPKESDFNPDAPVLSEADITAFRSDPLLRYRLRRSFVRFLGFLGLAGAEDGTVSDRDDIEGRKSVWYCYNHNWWRVSRVLTSLSVLGLEVEARALFAWLDAAFRQGGIGGCDEESRQEAARSHAVWASRVGSLAKR